MGNDRCVPQDPYLRIDNYGETLKRILRPHRNVKGVDPANLEYLLSLVEELLVTYSLHKESDREQADLLYNCLPDHVKARVPAAKNLGDVIAQAGITLQDYAARAPSALFDKLPEDSF